MKAIDEWHARSYKEEEGVIRSVANGSLYRSFVRKGIHGKELPYSLTWKLFVDSIPMSKSSSTGSATPVFLMPNEVALSKRSVYIYT